MYLLKDSIVLHPVPAGEGQMQVAVLPYHPYSSEIESFELHSSFVVTDTVPSEDIMNQYKTVFGLPIGIVTPKEQKIIVN
jgi:hypothetical protein